MVVLRENRSEFRLVNGNAETIFRIQVDHCLEFPGTHCDWLLLFEKAIPDFYIELKGSDVEHAFEQLRNSIDHIEHDFMGVPGRRRQKRCYVVATKVPLAASNIQKVQKEFSRNYQATLIVKKTPLEEDLNAV